MKLHILKFLLFLLVGMFLFENSIAQKPKAKKKTAKQIARENETAKAFSDLFVEIRTEIIDAIKSKKPCAEYVRYDIKNAKFNYDKKKFKKNLVKLLDWFYADKEINKYAKANSYLSNSEFVFATLSEMKLWTGELENKNHLDVFIKKFTGREASTFKEKEKKIFEKFLQDYHYQLYPGGINVKWPLYNEGNISADKKCESHVLYRISINSKYKYPKYRWHVRVAFIKDCDCNAKSKDTDIKMYLVYYDADLDVIYSSNGMKLIGLTNKRVIPYVSCCNEPMEEKDEPKSAPNPKKENSSLPNNYSTDGKPISFEYAPASMAGAGVGLGFNDDFQETEVCATFEYLHLMNFMDEMEDYLWFIGADLDVGAIISEFYKSKYFKIGPKLQLHKRILRVGQLQWVNGLKANYMSSNNESNGFNSTTTGIGFNLFTGLNFPVSKKLDLGVEVPLLNYNSSKTKPEVGEEYSGSDVSLLLNKQNLAKVLLRLRLGK